MKRWICVAAIGLTLAGCASPASDRPADGSQYSGGDGEVSDAETDCVARLVLDQMEGRRAEMTSDEMALECDDG